MALTNCSINSASVSVVSGQALTSSVANQVLTITPDSGYVLDVSDFSDNTGSLASGPIQSISLSNSGTAYDVNNTILVTVDLKDTFSTTSNVTSTIDIDGAAILGQRIPRSVSVEIAHTVSNVSYTNTTPATATGIQGSQATLFLNRTITANSGKFFTVEPSINLESMDSSRYDITSTTTSDSNGLITAKSWTVKFTFPNFDITAADGEKITFIADADGTIPTDDGIKKITNYLSEVTPMLASILTTRQINIYGEVGAQVNLQVFTGGSGEGSLTYDFSSSTFTSSGTSLNITIPSNGIFQTNITYPKQASGVTLPVTYTHYLDTTSFSGSDLASNLDSDDNGVFSTTVQQVDNISYSISATSSRSTITVSGTLSPVTGAPNEELAETQVDKNSTISLVESSNTLIYLKATPTVESFTNTNTSGESGESDISVDTLTITGDGTSQLDLAVSLKLRQFGTADSSSVLNMDNFINTPPVATDVAPLSSVVQVANNTAKTIQLAGTDADGDTITYAAATPFPSKGSVSINSTTGVATYTPSGTSSSGADSFGFIVNDGYQNSPSVTANVNIASSSGIAATFTTSWSYDDTEDSTSPLALIGASAFNGTPAYIGATGSSFSATFSGWGLDSTHAGFPSYVADLGDMNIKWRLRYQSSTIIDWTVYGEPDGSINTSSQTATININNITVNIPSSHNSGSLVSGGAYHFDWLVEYDNVLQ